MSEIYTMQGLLSDRELEIARKALRLPPGDITLTTEQLKDWQLIRDTWLQNITGENSHPGSLEERHGYSKAPEVVTKRVISMSKYRK